MLWSRVFSGLKTSDQLSDILTSKSTGLKGSKETFAATSLKLFNRSQMIKKNPRGGESGGGGVCRDTLSSCRAILKACEMSCGVVKLEV